MGVEFVSDLIGRDAKGVEGQTPEVAYASRLVVVSAGALGTPAILERSGIGAADILKKNDIKQLVDLPGVGQNYMGNSKCILELNSIAHQFLRPCSPLYAIHVQ